LSVDVNYCDEETEASESVEDALPKKTNFYALRKVVLMIVLQSLIVSSLQLLSLLSGFNKKRSCW